MSCRICYWRCTLFTYLLPVNHRSSSVKWQDSGGETSGSLNTWESLDSSGSIWKKTKRQRLSNLHRPRTRQIKYTVLVSHKSLVCLHFPSLTSFPTIIWTTVFPVSRLLSQHPYLCSSTSHTECGAQQKLRAAASQKGKLINTVLLMGRQQPPSPAEFRGLFVVVVLLLCILITCVCIWRSVFSACSPGGTGRGWWSIIAVSAEQWNTCVIMFWSHSKLINYFIYWLKINV